MLISPSTLDGIRRAVGPKTDEGRWQVKRLGAPTPSGSGYTKPSQTVQATVAGRVQFVGSLSSREKEAMGILRLNIDYVLTLEAGTDVKIKDLVVEYPLAWVSGKFYHLVEAVQPTTPTGKIYRVRTPGVTGGSEPTWPGTDGGTVVDGAATWVNSGAALSFEVVELMGPSTFGQFISKKALCNLKQL